MQHDYMLGGNGAFDGFDNEDNRVPDLTLKW